MLNKSAAITCVICAAIMFFGFTTLSHAGGCLSGSCHEDKIDYKYLHGPLAAEQAMGNGCVQCHMPDGKKCTEDDAGIFKFTVPKSAMCTSCHEKSESPDHVARTSDCLKCHSPHGSDTSPYMLRK